MTLRDFFKNSPDALAIPRIIKLTDNLWAIHFHLMKLLPAGMMLRRAREDGQLDAGSTVIETSSGTFALALAMYCRLFRYPLVIVSDPAVDDRLKRRLEELGTRLEIVETAISSPDVQKARLARLAQLRDEIKNTYWPNQYDNPNNYVSYAPVAEILAETIGQLDFICGPVGSGGSMCGTTTYLRQSFPKLRAVAVDTFGSVLFGLPPNKRLLRGLGNSLMPANCDHTIFDEVHWVEPQEAFLATRVLHREHSLFMGPTSGAAYLVALWLAARNPASRIAFFMPDEGFRYIDSVYDDTWLHSNGVLLSRFPQEPQLVLHPNAASQGWTCFEWGRCTYTNIMGHPFRREDRL